MRPRLIVVLAALRVVVAGSAAGAMPTRPAAAGRGVPNDYWSALERATITPGSKRGELTLELPPVDLPAGTVVDEPASVAEFPIDGSIYALHAELVDEKGRQLPRVLLHHMNVMDPSERELFLPIARRILASGMETGEIRFPWLLFGSRIHRIIGRGPCSLCFPGNSMSLSRSVTSRSICRRAAANARMKEAPRFQAS